MVSAEQIESKVKATIDNVQHVQATDISGGCGASFEVTIVSPVFEKKSSLAKHRLVNNALKEEIAELHAFTQKTYTPEQYAGLQSN